MHRVNQHLQASQVPGGTPTLRSRGFEPDAKFRGKIWGNVTKYEQKVGGSANAKDKNWGRIFVNNY